MRVDTKNKTPAYRDLTAVQLVDNLFIQMHLPGTTLLSVAAEPPE